MYCCDERIFIETNITEIHIHMYVRNFMVKNKIKQLHRQNVTVVVFVTSTQRWEGSKW